MAEPQLQRTVLVIECADDLQECVVHFEPEGAEYTLRRGDSFRVEAVLPPGYEIEIAYGPGRVSLWAEQTWGTRAFRKDGSELRI
ncbi:MAG: hypothetical protein ACRDNB_01420 [Gaiellaceae bacterium]